MATRVVILGTGFGGFAVATHLRRHCPDAEIIAVNRENYVLFTPMLPEVASGGIEPRHIAQPFRTAVPDARFVLGEVRGVDFGSRSVSTCHPFTGEVSTISYDHLVIALGSVNSTHGVPGADRYTIPLKTLQDAVNVRAALIRSLEAAATTHSNAERDALLTVVVVGGGFTGVEAAGEVLGYLRTAERQYRGLKGVAVRVVLVAGKKQLLEQLPTRFGTKAQRMLGRRGVEIVFDDEVASVDENGVALQSGKRFDSKTVIWSAGVRVPDVVKNLDVPHNKHGAIAVAPDLSVPGRPGAWALGDCASIPKPGGGTYPQTAQHAMREGWLLASNVGASQHATRSFTYRSIGMMASLGHRQGLADLAGVMIAGWPAWILWRAYYLSRLPGAARKARVALDWTFSLPFPTDIASIT